MPRNRKPPSAADLLFYAEVGARISMARETLEYTQRDLAPLVGLSHGQVSKIENAERLIDPPELRRFARSLHVDPNYLLFGSMAGVAAWLRPAMFRRYPELLQAQPQALLPLYEQELARQSPEEAALLVAPRTQRNRYKVRQHFARLQRQADT